MNCIKTYRQQAGLTQSELASRLGCEQSTISNYETGFRTPDVVTIQALIAVFRDSGVEVCFDKLFPSDTDAA